MTEPLGPPARLEMGRLLELKLALIPIGAIRRHNPTGIQGYYSAGRELVVDSLEAKNLSCVGAGGTLDTLNR